MKRKKMAKKAKKKNKKNYLYIDISDMKAAKKEWEDVEDLIEAESGVALIEEVRRETKPNP